MTRDALFAKARQLAAQRGITLESALSVLSKRRNYGLKRITKQDRTPSNVESPPRPYWWQAD